MGRTHWAGGQDTPIGNCLSWNAEKLPHNGSWRHPTLEVVGGHSVPELDLVGISQQLGRQIEDGLIGDLLPVLVES